MIGSAYFVSSSHVPGTRARSGIGQRRLGCLAPGTCVREVQLEREAVTHPPGSAHSDVTAGKWAPEPGPKHREGEQSILQSLLKLPAEAERETRDEDTF